MRRFVFCLLFASFLEGDRCNAEEIDLALLRKAVGAGINSIQSYDVILQTSHVQLLRTMRVDGKKTLVPLRPGEKPTTRTEFSRQVSDFNGRHRYERRKSLNAEPHGIQLFDGQRVFGYSSLTSSAQVGGRRPDQVPFEAVEVSYAATFRQLPYGGGIKDLLEVRKCRAFREGNFVVMECSPDMTSNIYPKFGFRFYFDPERAMMMRRIEVFGQTWDQPMHTTEIELSDVEGSVWAPTSVISTAFDDGREAIRVFLKVDVAQSSWNGKLPDELFTLTIPEGTRVIDKVRGLAYVTGKDHASDQIDDIVATAKDVIDNRPSRPIP